MDNVSQEQFNGQLEYFLKIIWIFNTVLKKVSKNILAQ